MSLVNLHQYNCKHYISPSTLVKVNRLDNNLLLGGMKGFFGINDIVLGSVQSQIKPMVSSGWWGATMERTFGPILTQGDFTRGRCACAQFVVARENILSLPRSFYERMYLWLVTNSEGQSQRDNIRSDSTRRGEHTRNTRGNWWTSRYMEWSWELIFTRCCSRAVVARREVGRYPIFFIVNNVYVIF